MYTNGAENMIGYLKGIVLYKNVNTVLLNVNGVGYEVLCSTAIADTLMLNSTGEIYIHTQVKEDAITLYGFSSLEERTFFNKLISVSGIGCKMGITILSAMHLQELAIAIASANSQKLAQIKGLGKKTAERIILELREKIQIEDKQSVVEKKEAMEHIELSSMEEDAILGLIGLGYSKNESIKAVQRARTQGAVTIDAMIRIALQSMYK